jgi:nucleoside-triphosphatase THEP1
MATAPRSTTSASTRRRPSPADGPLEATAPAPADLETPAIERQPWSVIGPDFIAVWGRADPKNPQPEHLELLGPTGSGKTFLLVQILIEMVRRRKSSVIFIATKQADKTVSALGWPVVDTWAGVRKHDQVVYWPRTSKTGKARKQYQAAKIQELLDRLWEPDANTIVIFDEFAYVESLDADLAATLQMYLREGRSHGITVVAGKQRPQGVQRDMHSETKVTIGFRMKDKTDNERLAEIFGDKKALLPVVMSLNRAKREFLLRLDELDVTVISWVDKPINPKQHAREQSSYRR